MSKQLNVNLAFTADTSQAAAQLQQLQKQLQDLVSFGGQKTSPLGLTKELMQATEKAAELKIALEGATNPKTGMLDLSKFNASLQKSNTSIQEYAQHLYNLGPAGQQAFSQLASSINQAEIPLKRSSRMLTEFATTLKNTARWQISSSILHGFMGTVQSAWRYAQNLNASLNDIRIVTGANVDEMAQFAEKANRSAKALSTTTNEYAKASLIYYQQGLDASQVQERTDITIKMANASGQSAETVSDQMTAVWNNFAKGGDDLERFADVMVRLGADTASSSDEIAQGLEKFAAIGDMVGLSFDNAAAALATVTATTRQSADTVGTAFKTIFARIQGLKLGETLEDGTDLNKYSEALATVGISIKEQNGELKDMDTILAEMGAKWTTLSKDQQVALAQTVAGVRQYNQLVALMDNFDFYEQNLERAENADGSLQKQADIYAESWEAASKRVTAAAEDIYDSLLKDNVFIKLTDGVAGFLNIIGDTIDGIGGMKGALALLGVVITRVFSQDIANSLERFAYNIKSFTKKGRENLFNEQLKTKQKTNQALRDFQSDGTITGSTRADVNKYQADIQDQMALRAKSLLDSGRQLSEVEQKKMQIMSDQVRILGEQATQAASLREQSEKTTSSLERQLSIRMAQATGGQNTQEYGNFKTQIKEAKELQTQFGIGNTMLQKFQSLLTGTSDKGKTLKNITQYFEEFIGKANSAGVEVGELQNIFNNLKNMKINGANTFINAFETELVDLGGKAEQVFMDIQTEAHRLADAGQMNPQQLLTFIQTLDQLQREFTETGTFTEQQIAALRDLGIQVTQTGEVIRGFTGRIPTMAEGIVAFGNTLSSLTMAFTSIQGLISTWNNQDATFGEKLIATFTTLGMVIPIVVTAFQQQNLAQMATMSSAIASALGLGTLSAAEIAAGLAGEAGAAGAVKFGAALWALLWPIGAVIAVIAILTGGIYLLFQAFTAENRAAKENAEAMAKQNEETKKLAEETNTLNNEIENLINTFNKQKAAGEDVADTYDELIKKLDQVRSNYESLDISKATIDLLKQAETIGIATGNWEQYYKLIEQAEEEAQKTLGKKAKGTVNASLDGAQAAFRKGDGSKSAKGHVDRSIGDVGADQETLDILSQYSDIISTFTDGSKSLSIDVSDPGKFLKDYEQMKNLLTDLEVAGKTSSDYYREIKVEFDAMADSAAEIKANISDAEKYDLEEKLETSNINPEDIGSITEYESLVNNLTGSVQNYYATVDEAKEAVERYLGAYDNLTGIQTSLDFLEKYERKLKDLKEEQTTTTQEVPSPTQDANGSIVAGTENNKTEAVQTKFVPVYEQAEVDQKVQEMQTYIEGLTQEEKITLGQLDLSEVDVTNIDSIRAKIEEKLSETIRAQAKIELQPEIEEFELDPGMIEDVADAFIDMAEAGEEGYEILGEDAEAAKDAAVRFGRLQKAVLDLSENLDDYKDVLKDVKSAQSDIDKAVVENSEGFKGFKKSIAGLIGTSEDLVDVDFAKLINPKDLEKAAAGNEAAIERIREAFIRAQVEAANLADIDFSGIMNELNQLDDGVVFDIDNTPFLNKLIAAKLAAGATAADIEAMLSGFGIDADVTPIMSDFDQVAAAAAGTADAVIANTSFEAEVTPEEVEQTSTSVEQAFEETITATPISSKGDKVLETGGDGANTVDITQQVTQFKKTVKPIPVTATESKTTTASSVNMKNAAGKEGGIKGVKVANAHKTPQAARSVSPATANNRGGGGGGGGGGGKPKVVQKKAPIEPKKKKDEIERYHEINEAIEDQTRTLDRLSKAKDKAYGANKLKAIDKEIEALKELNNLDAEHLKQIKAQLALDKKAAQDFGITFDESGRINNYDEIIQEKMDWWKEEQDKIQQREIAYEEAQNADENYDADGAIKLQIEQDKEDVDEKYEDFKDTITQYEETADLLQDTTDKIQDQFDQIAEKIIEKITYEIEVKTEFNDFSLDLLDFQINLLGDDFKNFSEIIAISGQRVDALNSNVKIYSDGIGKLYTQYELGALSLDQFVGEMKKQIPEVLSLMEEMVSLDKEMMEYYENAFDAAEEKVMEYITLIDSGVSKLDHFNTMLSLIGKENDKETLGVILEAQYQSASHKLKASTDWYKTTKKEYDALYTRWVNEKDALGPKELEVLEEKLKVAREKMSEADEQRLSDLEAVGEKAQEILQNNLDLARKKLEQSLVGSSLEDYMTNLDRLSRKQEEFLTNTNKMYETNKLIYQAQLEIDKTQNNRAKQQYNDYVKYIEQLQQTGKLSQYELSIAQAKYELLQAQIALEEAQDAKNQVRLTRDAEGNYGYVYTANENKVSEAEQAVADAENRLYNIGLEGAQDYQSKKAEILQEAVDTFASIEEQYQTGQIASEEEFNNKMTEAKQYYYDRLKDYDSLYYKALDTMQEESYGNTVDYELDSTNIFDRFATSIKDYMQDVEIAFDDYGTKVETVKQEVGEDLEAVRAKTDEVVRETEKLAEKTEYLTDEIDKELLVVREATSVWGAHRDEMYKNIEANAKIIEQLREIQKLQLGETEDYSWFIKGLVEQGQEYDGRLIQEALEKRWLKMEGNDTYNYQQMKSEYVEQYAQEHALSVEEAEKALQDQGDAWYKTLDMLRQYKIERTNWSAVEEGIKAEAPEADTAWIQELREIKLAQDWSKKIENYIAWNQGEGLTIDDEYLQEMLGIRQTKINALEDPSSVKSNEELLAPYIEKNWLIDTRTSAQSVASAATGGYTGEWGPEGKLAILHEKELILNAKDTENFLGATQILREISQMLDNNALMASLGMINLHAMTVGTPADQILEQEVTIHAEFPNVTDHTEIEVAIDNLINAASQHAYKV